MECPCEVEVFWIKMLRKLGIKGDIRINFMSGCWFHIKCFEHDMKNNEIILKKLMNRGSALQISRSSRSEEFDVKFNDYQILPKLFKNMLVIALQEEKENKGSWGVTWKDYPGVMPLDEKLEHVKGFELENFEILNDDSCDRTLKLMFKKEFDDDSEPIKEIIMFEKMFTE